MKKYVSISSIILVVIALASHATGEEGNANPEKKDGQPSGYLKSEGGGFLPGNGESGGSRFGTGKGGGSRPEGGGGFRPDGGQGGGRPGGGQGGGFRPGGGGGDFLKRLPLYVALDANQDGEIDAEEIANASKSLASLDKNADGKLTEDELRPPFAGGGARPGGGGGQRPGGGFPS